MALQVVEEEKKDFNKVSKLSHFLHWGLLVQYANDSQNLYLENNSFSKISELYNKLPFGELHLDCYKCVP